MSPVLRKTLKIVGYPVLGLAGFVGLYLGVAWVSSRIPVAAEPVTADSTIPLFIHSNGVHTDLVVPIRSPYYDWSRQLPLSHTLAADSSYHYVGLGWGDRGFYLETPTWGELKPSVAVRAGFWLGSSLIHATYFSDEELKPGPDCIALRLTPAQYARLVAYVQQSFQQDASGQLAWLPAHSYGPHDAFYAANSRYSLFHTCNTWANNGLKACGQKASLWTPFDSGILRQYQK